MATARTKRTLLAVLLLIIFWSCDRTPEEPVPVESIFSVLPEAGLTTTLFEFDATPTFSSANDDHPILIRYDWQNDGLWDQNYTTSSKIKHRFLKPGNYVIRMEARNMSGLRDTSFTPIVVEQGFSPPTAVLTIQPDSSNIYTWFSFNAAKSYDDEDSSDFLTFRWDFDGDGFWDTGFSSIPVIQHRYPAIGSFNAGVEVKDPTNRRSIIRKLVIVDLLNDSIQPEFTVDGGFSTVTDFFYFDASGSKFLDHTDKKLMYSWDIYNDNRWEANDLPTPFFKCKIKTEGLIKVKLRVTDDRGLYREILAKIRVFPENSPPVPVLVVGSRVGNLQTEFFFHSFGTTDRETFMTDLTYEWDVNEDGQWDSEFKNLRSIKFLYNRTGKHRIRLKVTDAHDDSVIATDTVSVYAGQHETGLFTDKRPWIADYYGMVKIGNLWWMQQNLFIEIKPTKENPVGIPRMCYGGDSAWCDRYGGLYDYSYISGLCPDGWRLPTRIEFQEMVTREAPNSLMQLLLGGSSELHLLLGGYIDIQGKSVGSGNSAHFWLLDTNGYGIPYAWYIDKSKGENRSVLVSRGYGFSVRCVKSE